MEKRRIGSLEVSIIGLGCNNFGHRIDETRTAEVFDAALDHGINFFDTADIYGHTKSEQFLGRIINSRRSRIVLASKFGMEVDPQKKGARPGYLRQACEDSLQRLQTDYLDLYQLHEPDPTVPIAETLGALDELVKAGKVREIGCSNFSSEQLYEAEHAVRPEAARFVSVQNQYSLLFREPEQGVLETCAQLNIAFIPFFPLASGMLTGKYRKGQPLPEGTRIKDGSQWLENIEKVEALIKFAEARGRTILELALCWLVAHKEVSSVIAGATSPAQIAANTGALGWLLDDSELAEVAGILDRTPTVAY